MKIAIVGGTGREGRGLAVRWARAGHEVVIGSRDADKARAKVAEWALSDAKGTLAGSDNQAAVAGAEVVLLSVPYAAHEATLRELAPSLGGRVLIDITVPIRPPKVTEVHLPTGQSAALEAQAIVGAESQVVAALHHISSSLLGDPERAIDSDVLVCSDSADAKSKVIALIGDLGMRGLDAGPLRNAIALESLTPVILGLNRRYKREGIGIRFTGI
jgi:NADPH-dependent F420 reductase